MEEKSLFSVTTTDIAAMGIGSALYAALNVVFNIFYIPLAQLVTLRPSVVIPMFFGFVFGPWVGFVTGFVGNTISDAISWGGFWWTWDVGNGLLGLVCGLAPIFFAIKDEELGSSKSLVISIIFAVLSAAVGMGFASYMDLALGYGVYTFEQATTWLFLPAFVTDAVFGAVLLPVFLKAYASAMAGRARAG